MVVTRSGVETGLFRHEALFYDGADDFVPRTLPFVREGIAADEAVLVAAPADRVDRLRVALGDDAGRIAFEDMASVGRNPACIIPVWADFVASGTEAGRRVRGVAEPVWPERSADELDECQLHESLLNVAFADAPGWTLVCPYDARALPAEVVERARQAHHSPVRADGCAAEAAQDHALPFRSLLPAPPGDARLLEFAGAEDLERVRQHVTEHAGRFGLPGARVSELVFVVHELAANSVAHGGGRGTLHVWAEGDTLLCDVRDRGVVGEPLAGRLRPDVEHEGGRGLWLVNHLAELVQLRSSPEGTTVRVHASRDGRTGERR